MASLMRPLFSIRANGLRRAAPVIANSVRNHWNYQYKPGKYPRTAEERAAAAKRYGLSLEEYQPHPEEAGYGDYPKLPEIGADSRDIYYPYDMPALKRNFNDPMNVREEIFGEDRYDPARRDVISLREQWIWFFGTIGGAYALYEFLEQYKMGRPVLAKQYPRAGQKHYTFDPKC